ncbi:MAG: T9SS type A sorting domain-containing protein, partial [Bacteroidales bacterium]
DTIYTTQADTIELYAGEFDSYLWQDSTTTATYDVTENISKKYAVEVSDAHGCGTDKDSVQVFTYNMGVTEMVAPSSSCELSETEEIKVKIKNYSYDTIREGDTMDIGYIMNETHTARDTKTFESDLLPGQTFTHTFSVTADMSEYKTYYFDLFTDHPWDADHSNDTLEDAVKTYGYPEFDLNYDTLYTTQADTVELYPDISENAYKWNTGSTNDTLYVSKPTTEEYKLTITDINSCSAVDSSTLITYDVGVTDMSSPQSACELTDSETISIEVTNHGADTLQSGTTIPVGYRLNGGSATMETLTLDAGLLPDDTVTHTFSSSLDMSTADIYDIAVFTDFADDAMRSNDTLNQQVEHYGYPDIDIGEDTLFTTQADTLELDPGGGYDSYLWQDGSTDQVYDVTSNETNLYHVEVTNEHGCSTSDSLQVIMDYDLKTIGITSPDDACSLSDEEKVTAEFYNQSRTIDEDETLSFIIVSPEGVHYKEDYILSSPLNTGDTLEWNFSQTLDLSEATTHQLKVYVDYDKDIFPGNDTASKTIEVYGKPQPDLGKDTVVNATSYTLEPGSFEAYEWHDGSTNQTFKVTPGSRTSDDKYHVAVNDQNGCTGRDTARVILDIDDIEIAEILSPGNLCGVRRDAPVEFILQNSGTSNIPKNTELPVSYQLNNNQTVEATLTLSEVLKPDETLTYTFSEKIDLKSPGEYEFNLAVEYEDDMWPDNNDTTETYEVYPRPEVDLGSDTLETELPHTLDPGDYDSYEWQDSSTESTFEVTDPGTYSVTVSNEHGCTAADTIVIRNANAIGDNKDQAENYTVKVYPVPAEDHLMIDLSANTRKQFNIKLINTQGSLLHTDEVSMREGTARISTGEFPRGMYYLRIEAESGVKTRKVILK